MSSPSSARVVPVTLVACGVLMLLHQGVHWDWYIEDSAISFAYARNWANGEGLVAYPGSERIEGYSNPTWVVLLALFELVGLSGFIVSKPMAAVFSLLTMWLVYRIAVAALPGRERVALIAPFVLACSAQFALWTTAALENSLFCLFLALGMERVLAERKGGGVPWSAVAFLALAWTRPEGLLYAAIGGAWFLLHSLRYRRGLLRVGAWLGLFWIPYVLLELLRLHYFAWPLANTYYAKVGVQGSFPLSWIQRGWLQARDYAQRLWQGWFLPIYFFGLYGARGPRGGWAVFLCVAVGALLLYPGPERLVESISWWPADLPTPRWFNLSRIWVLAALGAGLPFLALGRPGGDARGICWHMGSAALFFAVYANGDWMGGFRWMSLMAPSSAVLFAVGVVEIADRVDEWVSGQQLGTWSAAGVVTATIGALLYLPPNLSQTRDHRYFNHNETPYVVKRRAQYTNSVARKTFFEGQVVNLEMDQGAHMWWFPHYRTVDMAGLVDVPMSRHRFSQRPFIQEYVFDESKPTFAHVHGAWAANSGFKTYDDWHETYFELPGYDDKERGLHPGVWARRDLFMTDSWEHTEDRRVEFSGGAELVGFDLPAASWGPGRYAMVEIALRTTFRRGKNEAFSPVVTLSTPTWSHSFQVEPGHGFYPMHHWQPDEVYVGRFALPLPDDLPTGPVDIGLVILGPNGHVLTAGGHDGEGYVSAAATTADPRVARGEVRFPGLLTIAASGHDDDAEAAVAQVQGIAASGDCEAADDAWIRAKRHNPVAWAWHAERRVVASEWLASCWAGRAESQEGQGVDPTNALSRAHHWNHHNADLARVGDVVGDRLWAEGVAAREAGDHEAAYHSFRKLLTFQPWRSWARRYAEEARDERLHIDGLETELKG